MYPVSVTKAGLVPTAKENAQWANLVMGAQCPVQTTETAGSQPTQLWGRHALVRTSGVATPAKNAHLLVSVPMVLSLTRNARAVSAPTNGLVHFVARAVSNVLTMVPPMTRVESAIARPIGPARLAPRVVWSTNAIMALPKRIAVAANAKVTGVVLDAISVE